MCYCLCDVILSSNVYLTEKHKQPGYPMLNKVHTVDKVFAQLSPEEARKDEFAISSLYHLSMV